MLCTFIIRDTTACLSAEGNDPEEREILMMQEIGTMNILRNRILGRAGERHRIEIPKGAEVEEQVRYLQVGTFRGWRMQSFSR